MQTYKITNCLLINTGNEATIEKGILMDMWIPVDTMWLENNTVLNAGGVVIGRSNSRVSPNFAYYNRNTFVNTTLHAAMHYLQAEMVYTNNLHVNTGVVPVYPTFYPFWEDEDHLAAGVVNIDTVERQWIVDNWQPQGYPFQDADSNSVEEDRKMLVENNSTWWDSRFTDMIPDSLEEPGQDTVWMSQMINMNARTKAMFDDNENYPYLKEGTWYNEEPDFANNQDLVAEWVRFIVSNSTPGAPGGGEFMPWWRTNGRTMVTEPDWPILPDLSYTNATLLAGGEAGYPVGDLNWFPADKEMWEATNESALLIERMKAEPGTAVEDFRSREVNSTMISAYPNPFTEATSVGFEIAKASNVELVVYDILGKRVREMELGHRAAGRHEFMLNRGDLDAGIYLLQISTDYDKAGSVTRISIR
jgi:hypothetical protein